MILCKVTAPLDCSALFHQLDGTALVQLRTQDGSTLAAADPLGAKTGDRVAVCLGDAAQCVLGHHCPVDAAVIAVLNSL